MKNHLVISLVVLCLGSFVTSTVFAESLSGESPEVRIDLRRLESALAQDQSTPTMAGPRGAEIDRLEGKLADHRRELSRLDIKYDNIAAANGAGALAGIVGFYSSIATSLFSFMTSGEPDWGNTRKHRMISNRLIAPSVAVAIAGIAVTQNRAHKALELRHERIEPLLSEINQTEKDLDAARAVSADAVAAR